MSTLPAVPSSTHSNTERIERFQSLQPGQYWRARRDIPKEGIAAGDVLLIESLRWADEAVHTVVLRAHPKWYDKQVKISWEENGETFENHKRLTQHPLLLADFLEKFDHEPNAQSLRQEELANIQTKVSHLQQSLIEGQHDPQQWMPTHTALANRESDARHDDAGDGQGNPSHELVPAQDEQSVRLATGPVSDALASGVTPQRIEAMKAGAQRQQQIATAKANWIQAKTDEIAETLGAMAPYYAEQAAAALAQTEDVRQYVAKIQNGIESLDLYVGTGVTVTEIARGASAPRNEPLTFVQKKLMMDEELALWADVDENFDYQDQETFYEALRSHPGLVNQVFPAARAMLVMAVTQRDLDYGNAIASAVQNSVNKRVFILVRDGENIYRVDSPVESHLHTGRLFPSRDEHDALFRGLRGEDITFEDVAYTKALERHDNSALHYKRFLILACGLDHRLKLFGDFYDGPADFNFISAAFQQAHCRFLHDDAGGNLIDAPDRPDVIAWISSKNRYLRSGSRVLGNWHEVMDGETAPAACRTDYRTDRTEFLYRPTQSPGLASVEQDGKSLCVKVPVSGWTRQGEPREFLCNINLSKYRGYGSEIGYLCLDAVEPEELDYYMRSRANRHNHIFYIRFFKQALAFIQQERQAQAPTRALLAQSLSAHGWDQDRIATTVNLAVQAWRASHRGAPLPRFDTSDTNSKAWAELLGQALAQGEDAGSRREEIERLCQDMNVAPLRLSVDGKSRHFLYVTPYPEDRDDRISPHIWARRLTVSDKGRRMTVGNPKWALLHEHDAGETTLEQWGEAIAPWLAHEKGKPPYFPKFEDKARAFALSDTAIERLSYFTDPANFELLLDQWRHTRRELNRTGSFVKELDLSIPIGMLGNTDGRTAHVLCVSADPAVLLWHLAPDDASRQRVQSLYVSNYANKAANLDRFKYMIQRPIWDLASMSLKAARTLHDQPFSYDVRDNLCRNTQLNPLLAKRLEKASQTMGKDVAFWLNPCVTDTQGRLDLDRVLGITLPEDFEELILLDIQVGKDETQVFHLVSREQHEDPSDHSLRDMMEDRGIVQYRMSSHLCASMARAHSLAQSICEEHRVPLQWLEDMPSDAKAQPTERQR